MFVINGGLFKLHNMNTALQEMLEWVRVTFPMDLDTPRMIENKIESLLEKEKKQIQKAFSDGQEIPINHPTLPHYSRDEYYNDNYNN